ncbi:MAG TPA: NAD(P)-dependent oxidoreductase [Nitrospirota bacterium]|nr:NAD(P)-dependent oxidoreductase [Nitrospirota bacterium]
MKALVTGGTGFIGSNVVDLLVADGHSVRLFSRKAGLPARFSGKDVSAFGGDLEDAESVLRAMEGMDVFYHIGEIKNTSPRAVKNNVKLMEKVVGHLDASGIKRIVFISSISVAGIPEVKPATEETPSRLPLRDPYTRYKEQCEKFLSEKAAGTEYAVIRPGVVYGSGSRYLGGLIAAVDRLGTLGIPFVGQGRSIAPLVHVKDLARAVYRAGIEDAAAGRIFNITDGMQNTWSDFLHAIGNALGKEIRILPLPPLLFSVPARFFDLFAGLLGATMSLDAFVSYVTTDLLFMNDRAQQLLHWKPEYLLAQGVEEMVSEYRTKRGRAVT